MIYRILLISSVITLLLTVQSTTGHRHKDEAMMKIQELTIRLDTILEKNMKNEVKFAFLERECSAKMGLLETKNAEQDKEITQLKNKMDSKQDIRLPVSRGSLTKPTVPSSCKDLATNGHSFLGLYLVKNLETSKIQTVLCDFGTSVSEEVIDGTIILVTKPLATNPTTATEEITDGSTSLVTKPPATNPPTPPTSVPQEIIDGSTSLVTKPPATNPPTCVRCQLFDVKRNSVKGFFRKVVTYDETYDNVKSVMNLTSGIFTAPSQGVYFFEALTLPGIDLQVNGNGVSWTHQSDIFERTKAQLYVRVTLNAGDRVNLYNSLDVNPVKEIDNWSVRFKGVRL